MLGGYRFEELFGEPDAVNCEDLKQVALSAIKSYLNIQADPVHHLVSIHQVCCVNIATFCWSKVISIYRIAFHNIHSTTGKEWRQLREKSTLWICHYSDHRIMASVFQIVFLMQNDRQLLGYKNKMYSVLKIKIYYTWKKCTVTVLNVQKGKNVHTDSVILSWNTMQKGSWINNGTRGEIKVVVRSGHEEGGVNGLQQAASMSSALSQLAQGPKRRQHFRLTDGPFRWLRRRKGCADRSDLLCWGQCDSDVSSPEFHLVG